MWQEGRHDTRQATAIFADAMQWLWKGYPQPVKSGPSANDMLTTILDTAEYWQPVKEAIAAATKQEAGTVTLRKEPNISFIIVLSVM